MSTSTIRKTSNNTLRWPTWIGCGFVLLVVAVELVMILGLNDGTFVYTLDDPYIHLALAENIASGHYGINAGELSAPASSVLWPFLLAPLTGWVWAPLIANVLFLCITVRIWVRMLNSVFRFEHDRVRSTVLSSLAILLVLSTNGIGLIFTGMEHSLQVLLTVAAAWGLVLEAQENRLRWWLPAILILAPLIRYECLSIAVAGVGCLLLGGYVRQAVLTGLGVTLGLGGFSAFLSTRGLGLFPASVILKSEVVGSGGHWRSLFDHARAALSHPKGLLLAMIALALIALLLHRRLDAARIRLVGAVLFAILAHFLVGRFGWYHRYEIYILAFSFTIALFLLGPWLQSSFDRLGGVGRTLALAGLFVVLAAPQYLQVLISTPLASNNIYEQQYQMRRFAVDFYRGPVAVNDIGYVAYRNDNHVLDLWGLASRETLAARIAGDGSDWIGEALRDRDIRLAMVYEQAFPGLPPEWVKLGELRLGRQVITPAHSNVSFFAVDSATAVRVSPLLREFRSDLPPGAEFRFPEKP